MLQHSVIRDTAMRKEYVVFFQFSRSLKEIQKQKYSECNSVHKHSANFKKIIIKLSRKKARPPLGEALPSISAAAWGLG